MYQEVIQAQAAKMLQRHVRLVAMQELNVNLLKDSPLHVPRHKQLSAKAVGEPPMQMSAAVACALQDAIAAAWEDHNKQSKRILVSDVHAGTIPVVDKSGGETDGGVEAFKQRQQRPVLQLPATTANIKRALPPLL